MRALYVNTMDYGNNAGVDAIAHGLSHRLAQDDIEMRVDVRRLPPAGWGESERPSGARRRRGPGRRHRPVRPGRGPAADAVAEARAAGIPVFCLRASTLRRGRMRRLPQLQPRHLHGRAPRHAPRASGECRRDRRARRRRRHRAPARHQSTAWRSARCVRRQRSLRPPLQERLQRRRGRPREDAQPPRRLRAPGRARALQRRDHAGHPGRSAGDRPTRRDEDGVTQRDPEGRRGDP